MTEMINATVNGKFDIVLPKHRADRPEWYTDTGWEKNRLESMYQNIGEGDVVYYVGAEEGEMPALCQIWGAETVLFEPNPKVWSHFPLLWEYNNLSMPIACIPSFASDKSDKKARIYYEEWPPEAMSEINAAHGFKELHTEAEIYGQITIDACVYKHNMKPPTAISIDVEGSEWRVLGGAKKVLEEYKPKIWLSGHPEFMIMYWNEYLNDLRGFIKSFGYKEEFLDYQHEVHLFYETA